MEDLPALDPALKYENLPKSPYLLSQLVRRDGFYNRKKMVKGIKTGKFLE
jgi:hypothetical protein